MRRRALPCPRESSDGSELCQSAASESRPKPRHPAPARRHRHTKPFLAQVASNPFGGFHLSEYLILLISQRLQACPQHSSFAFRWGQGKLCVTKLQFQILLSEAHKKGSCMPDPIEEKVISTLASVRHIPSEKITIGSS